jgi:hypothetical protein
MARDCIGGRGLTAGYGWRGEARRGQRGSGKRRGEWRGGTWLGPGRCRGHRAAHMAGQRQWRAAEGKTEEGERGRRRGTET